MYNEEDCLSGSANSSFSASGAWGRWKFMAMAQPFSVKVCGNLGLIQGKKRFYLTGLLKEWMGELTVKPGYWPIEWVRGFSGNKWVSEFLNPPLCFLNS